MSTVEKLVESTEGNVAQKAKKIIDELVELTKGNIFPNIKVDEEKTKFMTGFIKLNYADEIVQNKIKEFVNTIVNDVDDFYSVIHKFANDRFEEYKKRQRQHYVYHTEVGNKDLQGKETKFKIYDMSVLKAQIDNKMVSEEYVKNIPDWMIDIKNFKDILIPYDCQTVYIYNPEQNAVVDIKTEELFLIPEE
jgi:hypothetical protein